MRQMLAGVLSLRGDLGFDSSVVTPYRGCGTPLTDAPDTIGGIPSVGWGAASVIAGLSGAMTDAERNG